MVTTKYPQPPVPAAKRWFQWGLESTPAPKPIVKARPTPMLVPVVMPTAGPVQPPVFVAATSPDPVVRLIGRLRDDLLPSMREVSADQLAHYGRGRPDRSPDR